MRQVAQVLADQRTVAGHASGLFPRVLQAVIEHARLDFSLGGIGQLCSVGAEGLEPVVLERVVAGRDHHAGVEPADLQHVGQARCADDPRVGAAYAARAEAGGHGVTQPGPGLARVASQHHATAVLALASSLQHVTQSGSERADGRPVQRMLAGDGANAVRAEQTFHQRLLRPEGVTRTFP